MNTPEAQLIAVAATTGDRQAFGALVQMHQSALRLVIRKWLRGDNGLADDLAQEAFVRAFRSIGKFRGESKFFTWLCKISYNVFIDYCRKKPPIPEISEVEPHNPSRGLDLSHDLERAMKRLSDVERVAITLCFHNDLTHEDAAQIMEIPLGTLKSHINRAKQKLSQQLGSWKEES